MEPETVKIYLDLPGILYKEKSEYQVFLHIVEDEEELKLVATVSSNSFFAVAKAANEGVVQTTVPLAEILALLLEEQDKIDTIEERG